MFDGSCLLDVSSFPMDSHGCSFFIQTSRIDSSRIAIRNVSNDTTKVSFTQHGEWEITDSSTEVLILQEPISGISCIALARTLKLSRRHLFVFLHTCLPLFLLGWLNIVVFIVSLKSGERITFAVTVLLTFIVFTTDISDTLPRNSLKLSYASVGMAIINCLCTITVITSAILCRMAHETALPVPDRLIGFTRRRIEYM